MNSICLSVAPNLRCQELTRIQNIILLIPPGIELIFSVTLAFPRNNAGGRKRWVLVLDGVFFFLLALADFLAHVLPEVSLHARVYRIVDIVIAAASCLPIISYTFFLFLFARSELSSLLPSRFKHVALFALFASIPPIAIFNELGSILGVTYTSIPLTQNNSRNQELARGVGIGFSSLLFQRLSLFFSSAALALLTLFQAGIFVLAFIRLVRAFLDERRTESAAAKPDETEKADLEDPEEIHLFRGVGWLAAGLKLGAIESVVGFTNVSFAVVIIRRSLRLFGRGMIIIGVIKGMNMIENLDKFESDVRALRGGVLSSGRTRYYSSRRFSSRVYATPPLSGSPGARFMGSHSRNSSFREIESSSSNSPPQGEKRKGRIGPSPLALELRAGRGNGSEENPFADTAAPVTSFSPHPNSTDRVTIHYDGKTPPVLHLRFSTLSLAPPLLPSLSTIAKVASAPATAIPPEATAARASTFAKRTFSLPAVMEDPREYYQGQGREQVREQGLERQQEEQETRQVSNRAASMPSSSPLVATVPVPVPTPTSTSILTPTPTTTPKSPPSRPPRARPPSQSSAPASSSSAPSADPLTMLTPAALSANTIASSVMLPVTPRPVRVRSPSMASDPLAAVREMAGRFPELPSHTRERETRPEYPVQVAPRDQVQAQVQAQALVAAEPEPGRRSVSVYSSSESQDHSQDGHSELQSPLQTVETISKSMSKSMMSLVAGAEMGPPGLTRVATFEPPSLVSPSSTNPLARSSSTPAPKVDAMAIEPKRSYPNLRPPLQIQIIQPQSPSNYPNVLKKPPRAQQQQQLQNSSTLEPTQPAPATLAERRRRRTMQVHQKLLALDPDGDKYHHRLHVSTGAGASPAPAPAPALASGYSVPVPSSSSSSLRMRNDAGGALADLPTGLAGRERERGLEEDRDEGVVSDETWRRPGMARLKSVSQVRVHTTPPAEQSFDVRGSLIAVEGESEGAVVRIGPVPSARSEAARKRREERRRESKGKGVVRSDSGVLSEEDRKLVGRGNVN